MRLSANLPSSSYLRSGPRVRSAYVLVVAVAACWLGLNASAQAATGYMLKGQFNTTRLNVYGVAVDQSSNDVYVATEFGSGFGPGDVERFGSSGSPIDSFGGGGGPSFTGVAINPSSHDVYALDKAHHVIDAFEPSGSPLEAFDGGAASSLPVAEEDRVLIATDSAGDIYYPNQPLGELEEFQPDGTPGPLTITGLRSPVAVAVASGGDIYVVDTEASTGSSQVQKFNSSGNPLGVLGAGVLSAPASIAIDASGDVFVADQTADGAVVDEFGSSGSLLRTFGAGILSNPGGIAVDSASGDVYIAEAIFESEGPVQIFGPSAVTAPTVSTGSATPLAPTEEQVTGAVNPDGTETTYHFEYGTTTTYGQNAPVPDALAGSGTAAVAVNTTLTGLEADKAYHCRLIATNAEGDRVFGADEMFTTQPAAPKVDGESASAITSTDATLEAQVNPNNQPTNYYFQYGTSATLSGASTVPAPPGAELGSGFGDQGARQDIGGGLSPGTTYYYRVIATNATTPPTEGAIESFTTLPPAPVADAEAASSVTQTGGTLNGSVTTQDAETTYHFQYVDDTSFHSTGWYTAVSVPQPEPSTPASPQPTAVSTGVGGLAPDTVYHGRLVATNAGGTTEGPEETFTTRSPRPSVTTGLPVSLEATSVVVQAGVNPSGAGTTYQFQYGTTTVYGAATPAGNAGGSSEPQPVAATLTGLAPGTTYHYRVIATNYSGMTEGQDQTFTTSVPTAAPGAGSSPFGSGAATSPLSIIYQDLSNLSPVPEVKLPSTPGTINTPLTRAEKLKRAVTTCRKNRRKAKRLMCEREAQRKYGVRGRKKQ